MYSLVFFGLSFFAFSLVFASMTDETIFDVANTLKGVLDGIVDAGVIPDDAGEWVKSITYLPAVKAKGATPALHVLLEDAG